VRIGLIRKRYTPYGGAEVFLDRFAGELIRRGHEVEVFSTAWRPRPGMTVHRVSDRGPSFLRPLIFAINARKAVMEARPDIVVSFDRTFRQDILRASDGCHGEWLDRRMRTVSALKRMGLCLNPLHRVMLHIERRAFGDPGLKFVVALSNAGKREIMARYGLIEDKIYVIYCGVDTAHFSPTGRQGERERLRRTLGLGGDTVALLFIGSGFERKGLLFLIRALSVLKDRGDVRLIVAGRGKAARYLSEAVRLGVADRVSFLGPVEDVRALHGAADVFVLPSIYEPFGNACIEAMASGLPVVTSRAAGASEVIEGGKGAELRGAVVEDPADHEALAKAIEPFLERGLRLRAGMAARREAERHTMEGKVDEFLSLVKRAL
jgi:UDP-glucose:(heptosyl)LPS alpha-1,3-glucosyltransferase